MPTATQGALVDPGQPYGNWTVCASSGGVKNTATVANTSYTSGNVVNVYLGHGSSGLTSRQLHMNRLDIRSESGFTLVELMVATMLRRSSSRRRRLRS